MNNIVSSLFKLIGKDRKRLYRPAEFRGWRVPDVLLSGNFAQIARWQEEQSYQRTRQLRPDLLNEE